MPRPARGRGGAGRDSPRPPSFTTFRDKRELYDTVLAGVFGWAGSAATDCSRGASTSAGSRIEDVVDAWVGYVAGAADGRPAAAVGSRRWLARTNRRRGRYERRRFCPRSPTPSVRGAPRALPPHRSDPFHLGTIVGATVFFVTATPRLVRSAVRSLSPEQLGRPSRRTAGHLQAAAGTAGSPPRRPVGPDRAPGEQSMLTRG